MPLTVSVPKELKGKAKVYTDNLSLKQLDDKAKLRGIEAKRDARINEAIACYVRKLPLLEERTQAESRPDLWDKIERLKDKLATCLKELELRANKQIVRSNFHDTVYYIDLTAGDDAKDGLSTGNAWKTIEKYTTTTVRTAGDIAYVRANTTEAKNGTISFDEDGTPASPISVIGCDATVHDPWGDASNTKPIIDFGHNANSYFHLAFDDYWCLTRLDIKDGNGSVGSININVCGGIVGTDLVVHGTTNAGNGHGVCIDGNSSTVILRGCSFYDNKTTNVYTSSYLGILECYDCTFNGGAVGTTYGINADARTLIVNCSFGQTTAHTTADIVFYSAADITAQNCKFNAASPSWAGGASSYRGTFFSEDHNQVKGTQYTESGYDTITSDSAVPLNGLNSIKIAPKRAQLAGFPSRPSAGYIPRWYDYAIFVAGGAAKTVTIKARETAAWTTDPTAQEFYFEASYLSNAATAERSFIKSAQALNGVNEIDFTMTFTPGQDGWVYIRCCLYKYEAGKSVNVSIKPVVS